MAQVAASSSTLLNTLPTDALLTALRHFTKHCNRDNWTLHLALDEVRYLERLMPALIEQGFTACLPSEYSAKVCTSPWCADRNVYTCLSTPDSTPSPSRVVVFEDCGIPYHCVDAIVRYGTYMRELCVRTFEGDQQLGAVLARRGVQLRVLEVDEISDVVAGVVVRDCINSRKLCVRRFTPGLWEVLLRIGGRLHGLCVDDDDDNVDVEPKDIGLIRKHCTALGCVRLRVCDGDRMRYALLVAVRGGQLRYAEVRGFETRHVKVLLDNCGNVDVRYVGRDMKAIGKLGKHVLELVVPMVIRVVREFGGALEKCTRLSK